MINNSIIVPPNLRAGFSVNIRLGGRFLYSHSLKTSALYWRNVQEFITLHFPYFLASKELQAPFVTAFASLHWRCVQSTWTRHCSILYRY